jgi:hypothetical protein
MFFAIIRRMRQTGDVSEVVICQMNDSLNGLKATPECSKTHLTVLTRYHLTSST